MIGATLYKRVVLSLYQAEPEGARLRLAAELAEFLRLDLSGIYIEDPNLMKLAGLPGVREFQLLSRQWQAIGGERLSRERALRLEAARRMFAQLAEAAGGRSSFEVMQAATAEAVASMWSPADIVVVTEPRSAAERLAQPLAGLTEAALRSRAAVLILPSEVARRRGPVIVMSAGAGDPSVGVAVRIAAAARERLIVIETSGRGPSLSEEAMREALSGPVERVQAPAAPFERVPPPLLERTSERLVVLTRDAAHMPASEVQRIASLRRVPVLALGAIEKRGEDRS